MEKRLRPAFWRSPEDLIRCINILTESRWEILSWCHPIVPALGVFDFPEKSIQLHLVAGGMGVGEGSMDRKLVLVSNSYHGNLYLNMLLD